MCNGYSHGTSSNPATAMNNRYQLFPGGAQPIPSVRPTGVDEPDHGIVQTRVGNGQNPAGSLVRELQVTGTAEVSSPADRASVQLRLGNSKGTVNEATTSVSRRLEYILQTVRQHGVREDDLTVRKFLHRSELCYHMNAEVTVTFSDFDKMEQATSLLLEKLDTSVLVGQPKFFHSAECLNNLRQSVCVSAVENAHQKASRISQLLGQSLGVPTLVREEETREWKSHKDDDDDDEDEDGRKRLGQDVASTQAGRLPFIPSITASSRVSVYFRMRDGNKKKFS
ncbi:interleukin-1 receptor-associated kinase 1-binding protein 1 homolog [Stigmatopora nigra]